MTDKTNHAYLIKGEWEFTLPLIKAFAQALICEHEGCQQCQRCLSIDAEAYPDFHVIQSESAKSKNISVKQIKGLVDKMALPPIQSPTQIFVLADAENMNQTSANALLKTLEEPPDNTVIVLSTARLSHILPTIRSRCQILYLKTPRVSPVGDWDLSYPDWEALQGIQSQEDRFVLLADLEKLQKPQLLEALTHYQQSCWQTLRQGVSLHHASRFKQGLRWIQLFEKSLQQLSSNANKRLILEFLTQDIWRLNHVQNQRKTPINP